MSSDVAPLVIKVEHATAGSAADALARLSKESHTTEAATDALRAASQQLAGEMSRLAKAAEDSAASQRRVEEEMRRQAEESRKLAATRSTAALDAQKRRELEIVRQSLRTQEEALRESYLKQRQIIEGSGAPKATQIGLLARLDKRQAEDIARLRERENAPAEAARKELASLVSTQQAKAAAKAAELAKEQAATRAAVRSEYEEIRRGLLSEEAAIKSSYDHRRAIVMASVASQAEQQRLLRGLNRAEARDLSEASPGLGRQLAGAAAVALPVAGAAAATAGLIKVGAVTREFEVLNAGLITSTGSAEGAAAAFEALQQKAADTPYKLTEVTSAFTKLVNYGLQPSERALTSYGNTSSAQGKQIEQMIEAVADATQGEYERLKEFGIKASSQGDKVVFMFRGVKTTVDRDSKSIQDYLIRLGETNFGDAMANRMATLDGKISNLGDAWDALFRQMGQAGIGDLLKDAADTGIEALTGLTEYMQSSSFQSGVNALKGGMEELAHVAHKAAGFAVWLATGDTSMSKNADWTIQQERERLATEALAAEQAAKEAEEYRALAKELKTAERNFADLQAQQKKGLVDATTVKTAEDSLVILRSTTKEAVDTLVALDAAQKKVGAIRSQAGATIAAMMAKGASRKDATAEVERRLSEAAAEQSMLNAQYQRLLTTPQGDRTARFEKAGDSKGKTKAQEDQEKKDKAEFEALQQKLRSEEDAIEASYKRRQQLIDARANKETGEDVRLTMANDQLRRDELAGTKAARAKADREKEIEDLRKSLRTQEEVQREGMLAQRKLAMEAPEGAARDAMLSRIQDKYAEEVLARNAAEDQKIQAIRDGFATEMELFQKQQDEKRQAILDAERVTAEERNALLAQLQAQTDERMAAEDAARNEAILKSSADLFGGLAKTAKNLGAENSSTYRALFAAQRAFSIASGTMAIATGAAKALELGWPAGIVAGFEVAAQGAALMAQITNPSYSGAYDKGGDIPAGKFGIAGERGPEIVWGPATVTSRAATERIAAAQQPAYPQGPQSMRIVVAPDPNTAGKYLSTNAGEQSILAIAGTHATELTALLGGR